MANPQAPQAKRRGRGDLPDASDWGQMNSRLARAGFTVAQRRAAIGRNRDKTRAEMTAGLAVWLRNNSP